MEHLHAPKVPDTKFEDSFIVPSDPKPIDLWKLMDDKEYINPSKQCDVPVRSYFTYMNLSKQPIYIPNNPPKVNLTDLLRDMIKFNKGATTLVFIGARRFQCMPTLLRTYSMWFSKRDWRLSTFSFQEYEVPALGFELLYDWMRHQSHFRLCTLVPVLQAAIFLETDLLQVHCWEMLAAEMVHEKKAFQLFMQSRGMSQLAPFRDLMLSRVREYFLPLVGHDDFLKLSVDEVMNILCRDTIGVNSEIEVFFAAVRWLNKEPESRQKLMRRVMSCVRFSYMPIFFLFSLKDACNRIDTCDLFKSDPMMLAFHMDPYTIHMLEAAIVFITQRCQHKNVAELERVCDKNNLKMWKARRWICDRNCFYHMREVSFPYQHRFTATDFSEYISSLQLEWINPDSIEFKQRRVHSAPERNPLF